MKKKEKVLKAAYKHTEYLNSEQNVAVGSDIRMLTTETKQFRVFLDTNF